MRLPTLLLLPLALLASAIPEADPSPDTLPEPEIGTTPTIEARAFSRPQACAITGGATYVNCRTGPGTGHRVRQALRKGTVHPFWCVVSAQCVTVNGARNCGWHYIRDYKCYVNGHYTDNSCTLARLGKCGYDDNKAAGAFN
ncbi:hypothetical protein C8A05DRAFT_34961 [Staphylotrichum tortipilum]|uniref:Uncharacterized protein n=1 Tax=Staphylotrichum tortipilum TaxID=2831512 RepID=A0AAN6RTA9_9PEZI|nr:hypothetical protein C8A05DRAFT_34961 [Staphylotrichum longicolle]